MKISSQHDRDIEIKQLSATIDQLRRDIDALRTEKEHFVSERCIASETREAAAIDAHRRSLEVAMQESNHKVSQILSRHALEMEALKRDHALETDMASRAHEIIVADLKEDHMRELGTLAAEHREVVQRLEQKVLSDQRDWTQKVATLRREQQQQVLHVLLNTTPAHISAHCSLSPRQVTCNDSLFPVLLSSVGRG